MEAGQHLQGGRLAGPVGTEQGNDLSGRNAEVDTVEHLDSLVGGPHPAELEKRRLRAGLRFAFR